MKDAIYLPPVFETEQEMIEIRSGVNNALVGTIGEHGLYYWERRANIRLLLSWSEIIKYYQKQQEDPLQS